MLHGTHHSVTPRGQQPLGVYVGHVSRPEHPQIPKELCSTWSPLLHHLQSEGNQGWGAKGGGEPLGKLHTKCRQSQAEKQGSKSRSLSGGGLFNTNLLAIWFQVLRSQTYTLPWAEHPWRSLVAVKTTDVRSPRFKGPLSLTHHSNKPAMGGSGVEGRNAKHLLSSCVFQKSRVTHRIFLRCSPTFTHNSGLV